MFTRDLTNKLLYYAAKLPVIAILGPRQSGKTTLAQLTFAQHKYISFEDIDQREFARKDPREFLRLYSNEHGMILDEIQYVPDLMSYIQTQVDREKKNGYFILTGSQNFLVTQTISQTLAGRIAILTLLPFSLHELKNNKLLPETVNTAMLNGGYPRLYANNLEADEWLPFYIQNYLERDVRLITNVVDLSLFQKFMKLCAGRIGQLLNIDSLARDCGISAQTVKAWLSVLQASYIIYLLPPYFNNFSKRQIKTPKLYFYDTGIACSLLSIKSADDLGIHYLRGGLFESMVITELHKTYYNAARRPDIYFWQNSSGLEIDALIDHGSYQTPIEIKSSSTFSYTFFDNIAKWHDIAQSPVKSSYVIYTGDENQTRSKGEVVSWNDIFDKITMFK